MKIYILITFIFLTFPFFTSSNKNKGSSKFDRHFNECKITECVSRPGDEDCIFLCISKSCYEEIFSNYLIEIGEFNGEMKNKFEACFNNKNKKHK